MASPITPEVCPKTGRLMTEWYEYAELTEEQLDQKVLDELGLTEVPQGDPASILLMPPEFQEIWRAFHTRRSGFKRRKFVNNMSNVEVAARMNEATKIINPDNFKFLPQDVRERTGLEINPLWQMEVMVRAGILGAKDQLSALTTLAAYTHSKAATLSQNTNINLKPEDWLEEIAKDEYETVDDAEIIQPKQRREKGAGVAYERVRARKDEGRQALIEYQAKELNKLTELEDYYIEEGLPELSDDDA
jgi:hypothetical protein